MIAHCQFELGEGAQIENINIRVYKQSQNGLGLRSASLEVIDQRGDLVEEADFDAVYSQRVRKEHAGAFGEALTLAQGLGISNADSIMLYGVDLNLERPIGLAVVHDADDDPIDRFVIWGRNAYRCAGVEDARSCSY